MTEKDSGITDEELSIPGFNLDRNHHVVGAAQHVNFPYKVIYLGVDSLE